MFLSIICLICVSASALAVSSQPARLLPDMDMWDYYSDTRYLNIKEYPVIKRFWGREVLRAAAASVDWESLQRIVHKLNLGQPIVVVALGSSVTHDYGGEWFARPGLIQAVVPRPVYRHPNLQLGSGHVNFISNLVAGDGFLRMFMHMINTTWPHRDHVAYNAGMSARSILLSGAANCLEAMMPNVTVDLILGEFIPNHDLTSDVFHPQRFNHSGGPLLERMIWRIATYYNALHLQQPSLAFLQTLTWDYNQTRFEYCHPRRINRCNESLCAMLPGPLGQREREVAAEWAAEANLHSVLRHYRCTGFSIRSLLRSAANDSLLANTSDCNMARHWYQPQDPKHPATMGVVLYADLLVSLIADAAVMVHRGLPAFNTTQDLSYPASSPKQPLFRGGHDAWQMRCYGHTMSDVAGSQPTTPADDWVVNASQWQQVTLQLHVKEPGATPKYKPGWVASQPGSKLHMRINTAFNAEDTARRATNVTVSISFLRSYNYMGMAEICCVANCVCSPMILDANNAERVSVAQARELKDVTQHKLCTMELTILNTTHAPNGGFKFKLIQVIVKSLIA